MFPDLHRIQCPTLVKGGEDDPIHPIESQANIAAATDVIEVTRVTLRGLLGFSAGSVSISGECDKSHIRFDAGLLW
jgi:poly(3-hydroxyalkanoate) synthetase